MLLSFAVLQILNLSLGQNKDFFWTMADFDFRILIYFWFPPRLIGLLRKKWLWTLDIFLEVVARPQAVLSAWR